MNINVKIVFICATILTIFAGGSVLMSLVSTGAKPINEDVSNLAASYSSTFLGAAILIAFLIAITSLLKNRGYGF